MTRVDYALCVLMLSQCYLMGVLIRIMYGDKIITWYRKNIYRGHGNG